jgi:hypothetical protein
MKTNILKITAMTLMLAGGFGSCGEKGTIINIENSDYASCEDKKIVKVLKDEPVYIRKHCFEHVGRIDTFYFDLVNSHSEFFSETGLFPCGEIPEQYRKDGLCVSISGDVTSCVTAGGCIEPNIRLAYIHFFELKSIKINNKDK